MKAIILAAGRGRRMGTLTDERPKCLVEIRGQTLLERQLAALRAGGADEIGIVTGYRRELLTDFGLHEFHNPRWEQTQMVASLACAEKWLTAEPCLVSYADIFYQPEAVRALIACNAALALTYDIHWQALWTRRFGDPLQDAETFRLQPDGTLAEIGRKPKTLAEIEGQYMGLLRFTPNSWAAFERMRAGLSAGERDRLDMTSALQRVIDAGELPVFAIPYQGPWGEVDAEEDLRIYDASLSGSHDHL